MRCHRLLSGCFLNTLINFILGPLLVEGTKPMSSTVWSLLPPSRPAHPGDLYPSLDNTYTLRVTHTWPARNAHWVCEFLFLPCPVWAPDPAMLSPLRCSFKRQHLGASWPPHRPPVSPRSLYSTSVGLPAFRCGDNQNLPCPVSLHRAIPPGLLCP